MVESFAQSPAYFVVLGLLCGLVGFRLGWRSARASLLPLIQGLFGFVAFATAWRGGGAIPGALAVGAWAVGTTLYALPVFLRHPQETDRRVWRARPYREQMLDWLRTGKGPETRPLATARAHLYELAAYLAAATLTVNLLSIVLGALLLNYMNAYVSRLLVAARRAWTVRLLSWNVWSVIRVAAYVMLGSAAAAPAAALLGYPSPPGQAEWLLWTGGAGVVLDFALKLSLSRPCGRLLGAAIDLEATDPPAIR
ncbi:MAG: hypothetical protein ACYTGC_06305 [Planctomycetota bacterium]